MTILRVQKRFITYEVVFEQKEDSSITFPEVVEWQVVDAGPGPPFEIFEFVTQEQIDSECEVDA